MSQNALDISELAIWPSRTSIRRNMHTFLDQTLIHYSGVVIVSEKIKWPLSVGQLLTHNAYGLLPAKGFTRPRISELLLPCVTSNEYLSASVSISILTGRDIFVTATRTVWGSLRLHSPISNFQMWVWWKLLFIPEQGMPSTCTKIQLGLITLFLGSWRRMWFDWNIKKWCGYW
jgi:hypothetical protein